MRVPVFVGCVVMAVWKQANNKLTLHGGVADGLNSLASPMTWQSLLKLQLKPLLGFLGDPFNPTKSCLVALLTGGCLFSVIPSFSTFFFKSTSLLYCLSVCVYTVLINRPHGD